jgi:hypothetical protein
VEKPLVIQPFPENINRDRFGDYVSGLADGEGSFVLATLNNKKTHETFHCRFVMCLRQDDSDILHLIRSYWGCGRITNAKPNSGVKNAKPTTAFRVSDASQLSSIVVPHFERHPMYAKKRHDFAIWRRALDLVMSVKSRPRRGATGRCGVLARWSHKELEEFRSLMLALKAQRSYGGEPFVLPERVIRPLPNQSTFSWN